jgi:imidazole glycerol-phosphate synthase subunit HisH
MKIAIIKYNAGNIMSVEFALKRLGVACEVTDDFEKIKKADKVIFPGVGEASTTMAYLRNRKMDDLIKSLKQPVLGICLGLQLMCKNSEEGKIDCLGIFEEEVKLFEPKLKVPHMGWNTLNKIKSKLFSAELENLFVYFVHSYYAETGPDTIAVTDYIVQFSAALHKNNFYATQFHPEKSGEVGAKILKNFVEL